MLVLKNLILTDKMNLKSAKLNICFKIKLQLIKILILWFFLLMWIYSCDRINNEQFFKRKVTLRLIPLLSGHHSVAWWNPDKWSPPDQHLICFSCDQKFQTFYSKMNTDVKLKHNFLMFLFIVHLIANSCSTGISNLTLSIWFIWIMTSLIHRYLNWCNT